MKAFMDEKGNISLLVLGALVVLLGFAGLSIDMGMVYAERTQMIHTLDAAALAGAMELPANRSKAVAVSTDYIESNGLSSETVQIEIAPDNRSLVLTGQKQVSLFFLKALGLVETTVNARSKVVVAPVSKVYGGIRPYAVEDFPYTYGNVIRLKEGAGASYHGNFGVVALGGTGASVYEQNALYGYKGAIAIGDEIPTETGNMAGVSNTLKKYIQGIPHTFENHPKNSDRIWIVPVVSSLEVSGRDTVTVVGFASVFVEDIERRSGKIEIDARFLKFVVNGDLSLEAEDRGVYGIKLVP